MTNKSIEDLIPRRNFVRGTIAFATILATIGLSGFLGKPAQSSEEKHGNNPNSHNEKYILVETYNLQPVRAGRPEGPAEYKLENRASNLPFNDCEGYSRGHKDNEGRCVYDSLEAAQEEADLLSRLYTEKMKKEWDNYKKEELRERINAVTEKLNEIGSEEVKKAKGVIHKEITEKHLRSPVYLLKPVPINN